MCVCVCVCECVVCVCFMTRSKNQMDDNLYSEQCSSVCVCMCVCMCMCMCVSECLYVCVQHDSFKNTDGWQGLFGAVRHLLCRRCLSATCRTFFHGVLQCIAACCSVLCCNVLHCVAMRHLLYRRCLSATCRCAGFVYLQLVARFSMVCCSVLQRVSASFKVLQRVVVCCTAIYSPCCSVLPCDIDNALFFTTEL